MTGPDFTAWRTRMALTQGEAAKRLGLDPRTVQRYEAGQLGIARTTILACAYLELAGMVEGWISGEGKS